MTPEMMLISALISLVSGLIANSLYDLIKYAVLHTVFDNEKDSKNK